MPIYEESCVSCGFKNDRLTFKISTETEPCPECGGSTERLYSLQAIRVFTPFRTPHITGKPIEIRNDRDLSRICHEHGVVPVPDLKIDPPQQKPTVKFLP